MKEIQEGDDKCQESWVPKEKIQELLNLCTLVYSQLDDKNLIDVKKTDRFSNKKYTTQEFSNKDEIIKLLPPSCGFFFGDCNIDKWYKQDIKDTIDFLKPIKESNDIYYQASW